MLIALVVFDMVIVAGIAALITMRAPSDATAEAAATAVIAYRPASRSGPPTPTPWQGTGPRATPTPTIPPTPLATQALAASGFPVGFTPTPGPPTATPATIKLPQIVLARSKTDVPIINQMLYPEPFFPPGTNNACGPIALYAAMQGLNVPTDYTRLRNYAVNYGFTSDGISKWGLISTASSLNRDFGEPLHIEHGTYTLREVVRTLARGGVVLVLVNVQYTSDGFRVSPYGFGHFLLVERVLLKSRKVKMAGSTLGMDEVPLTDFLRAWTYNPYAASTEADLRGALANESYAGWALVLKRQSRE